MDIKQAFTVQAPRRKVWDALMDPEILRQCIPGCQSVEKDGEDTFDIVLVLRVAGQKVRFTGAVELENVDPQYSFDAQGSVRIAGFGFTAATAEVYLRTPDGLSSKTTVVDATVKANISGKIAFIGERIIMRHALRVANEFFRRFDQLVVVRQAAAG
jgi:carbon monoxide dehydrogenase subunit G